MRTDLEPSLLKIEKRIWKVTKKSLQISPITYKEIVLTIRFYSSEGAETTCGGRAMHDDSCTDISSYNTQKRKQIKN